MSSEVYKLFRESNQAQLNSHLEYACYSGNLDHVRYLLTSPELTEHADINYDNGNPLSTACYCGKFEVVKYLLTSPDLKESCNIHAANDDAIAFAARGGHLDIVKYLAESPELKEHANVHAQNDRAFKFACENEKIHVLEYFIVNLEIPKIPYIAQYLKTCPNKEVESMFALVELKNKLKENLESDKAKQKKIKL